MDKKMIALGCLFALILTAVGLQAQPSDKAPSISLEVVGLSLDRPEKPKSERSRFISMNEGTKIKFKVSCPDVTFLSLDEKASKVESFTDDKGTNLYDSYARGTFDLDSFRGISKDGHTLNFKVQSPDIPAKGAKEITLKASAIVTVGKDKKQAKAANVSLAKDTAVTLGNIETKISKVGKPSWGSKKDTTLAVSFQANKSFDNIIDVVFETPEGKKLKSRKVGSMSGMGTWRRDYHLEFEGEAPEAVTIKTDYYAKTETLTIPIDKKITVGL